jgi:DNA-binding NarL/FixJ family response regulator
MLIEDQQSVRSTLGDLLRSTGDFVVVVTLGTEAEALDWIGQHAGDWDFAVVDLVLDQGNGFNVIKRARESSPQAKIVVLTAFASHGMRHHCRKLGADAVFDKADLPSFLGYCGRASPRNLQAAH